MFVWRRMKSIASSSSGSFGHAAQSPIHSLARGTDPPPLSALLVRGDERRRQENDQIVALEGDLIPKQNVQDGDLGQPGDEIRCATCGPIQRSTGVLGPMSQLEIERVVKVQCARRKGIEEGKGDPGMNLNLGVKDACFGREPGNDHIARRCLAGGERYI